MRLADSALATFRMWERHLSLRVQIEVVPLAGKRNLLTGLDLVKAHLLGLQVVSFVFQSANHREHVEPDSPVRYCSGLNAHWILHAIAAEFSALRTAASQQGG